MLAFEVSVNGQQLCVAAAKPVLSAILSWTPAEGMKADLNVGGISERGGVSEYVDWVNLDCPLGDEIVIRVIDTDSPDEPRSRRPDEDRLPIPSTSD
jgi:hypothetical protein